MGSAVPISVRKEVARRTRKVQRTLSLPDLEPGAGDPASPRTPTVSAGPPPCRAALANWPVEWRERWGRRANDLEDAGLHWKEAEARAFVEVWNERRTSAALGASSLVSAGAVRN